MIVVRDNKIKQIKGPFNDLQEATEKQLRKNVMRLQMLDIRGNKLTQLVQENAIYFLMETVVLMWQNPFDQKEV